MYLNPNNYKRLLLIITTLLFVINHLFAQKEDAIWTVGSYLIDFNIVPPSISVLKNRVANCNNSCISDNDGKLLFYYNSNKLFDADGNQIFTNIGSLMWFPSLFPYPYDKQRTLFFYTTLNEGVHCDIVDNNSKSIIGTTKQFPKEYRNYKIIQQKNSQNLWYLASVDNQIEISLITHNGFSKPFYFDYPYNMSNAVVSSDNALIVFHEDKSSVVCRFNNSNGTITKLYEFNEHYIYEFSSSGRYLYFIEPDNQLEWIIARYDLWSSSNEETLKNTKSIVGQINDDLTLVAKHLKLGPDGNIYIISNLALHAICNADCSNPYLKCNIINSDKSLGYLPYTFRYIFDKGYETGIYAYFDNLKVCYGESLKILLFGNPPFEITFTFNGEVQSVSTSQSEYTMPNLPGKYSVIKIKDQFCEYEPTQNNTAEILPKLNKLAITTNDD